MAKLELTKSTIANVKKKYVHLFWEKIVFWKSSGNVDLSAFVKAKISTLQKGSKMAKNDFIFLNGIFWHCKFCHNRKNHFLTLCNAMLRCNYQEKYLFTLLISLDMSRLCNKTQWMPHIPSAGSICPFWVQIG